MLMDEYKRTPPLKHAGNAALNYVESILDSKNRIINWVVIRAEAIDTHISARFGNASRVRDVFMACCMASICFIALPTFVKSYFLCHLERRRASKGKKNEKSKY